MTATTLTGRRLIEALRNDHELLHAYLGDEMFNEMGHAYVKARPSEHPNLRWFSQGLQEFLKSTAPYSEHPELSDLAALEKALNDAFDAAEGKVVELTKKLKIGQPTEGDTNMAAVINKRSFDSTLKYIEKGKAEGGQPTAGLVRREPQRVGGDADRPVEIA